jgi:hypothetical protein
MARITAMATTPTLETAIQVTLAGVACGAVGNPVRLVDRRLSVPDHSARQDRLVVLLRVAMDFEDRQVNRPRAHFWADRPDGGLGPSDLPEVRAACLASQLAGSRVGLLQRDLGAGIPADPAIVPPGTPVGHPAGWVVALAAWVFDPGVRSKTVP